MPDWFLIAVFLAFYLMLVFGLAFIVSIIIGHLVNIAWILLRKVFKWLPEDRDEFYEQTIEQARTARAKFLGVSDRDEHQSD